MARDQRKRDLSRGDQQPSQPEYDHFAYDDNLEAIMAELPQEKPPASDADATEAPAFDTPEEAMAKFRAQHGYQSPQSPASEEDMLPRQLRKQAANKTSAAETEAWIRGYKKQMRSDRRRTSLHDFLFRLPLIGKRFRTAEEQDAKEDKPHKRTFHKVIIALITVVLVLFLLTIGGSYFFNTDTFPGSLLKIPSDFISNLITPTQDGFSWMSESVSSYFRKLKLRATLEEAYDALVAENEQLTYQAMLATELQYQLSQYEDIYDEINANRNMEPVAARVIGKYDGNYFSTFTINKGKNDGLEPFMAVTISGALIGYTEEVRDNESTVRTIIDSESSIAALIQSSRDQGIVTGTLGIDGTALCRMYYLPDDNLPRPGDVVVTSGVGMSFPKGIPIGTVRESTRGMDANKQYVVVEPSADFQHIEYVIVYRYQPEPEAIQDQSSSLASMELVPLETVRPVPTIEIGSSIYFLPTATPDYTPEPSPTPTPTPQIIDTPQPTSDATPTPVNTSPVYEYQVVEHGPTATPSPEPTPTPTPFITYSPDDLNWEDD